MILVRMLQEIGFYCIGKRMNQETQMKIILASDENYFMYIYISVLTLFESNRSQNILLHIFIRM